MNGVVVGETPVWVPVRHYGVYEIELRKEGFAPVRAREPVPPPGYARFPLGIVTELLWLGTIHDDRYLDYVLAPPSAPDRALLIKRAEEAAAADGPP